MIIVGQATNNGDELFNLSSFLNGCCWSGGQQRQELSIYPNDCCWSGDQQWRGEIIINC